MLTLKRIVTIAVMVYLSLALLFILAPAVRLSVMGIGTGPSVLEQERQFFYVMFVVGAVVLTLQLITENLDSILLRRAVTQSESKINELKAKLYDHQQRTAPPLAAGSRTIDGRVTEPAVPLSRPASPGSSSDNRTADHLPQPTFPQNDPSLSNTPPADRPAL